MPSKKLKIERVIVHKKHLCNICKISHPIMIEYIFGSWRDIYGWIPESNLRVGQSERIQSLEPVQRTII